jgi:ABC-type glycerol-3-phosphate transport system substrate-binding protein
MDTEQTVFSVIDRPLSRRRLLQVLGMSGVSLAVAACAPVSTTSAPGAAEAGAPAAGAGEVTFMLQGTPSELEMYQEWAKKYSEEHSGTTVLIDFLPFADYETKLRTMLAAKNPPDHFWLYFNNIIEFTDNGLLQPFGDRIAASGFPISDFAQANRDMFTVGGSLYGIPRESSTLVLFWSKKAFADAGLEAPTETWTWEGEFLDAAKALTVASDDPTQRRYGFSAPIGAGMNWAAMPVVWSFGGDIVNADKTAVTANAPETVAGYQWLADLVNVHQVAPALGALAGQSVDQLFLNGQVGMQISGKWSVQPLREAMQESGLEGGFDVIPLPAGPAGQMTRTSGGAYAIPRDAKNAEGAWELIKFWSGEEFTKYYTETGGLFPAYLPVLNSDSFLQPDQEPNNSIAFVTSLEFARPEAIFGGYAELTNLVESGLDPVYSGAQTAQLALDEVQRKAEGLLP